MRSFNLVSVLALAVSVSLAAPSNNESSVRSCKDISPPEELLEYEREYKAARENGSLVRRQAESLEIDTYFHYVSSSSISDGVDEQLANQVSQLYSINIKKLSNLNLISLLLHS